MGMGTVMDDCREQQVCVGNVRFGESHDSGLAPTRLPTLLAASFGVPSLVLPQEAGNCCVSMDPTCFIHTHGCPVPGMGHSCRDSTTPDFSLSQVRVHTEVGATPPIPGSAFPLCQAPQGTPMCRREVSSPRGPR